MFSKKISVTKEDVHPLLHSINMRNLYSLKNNWMQASKGMAVKLLFIPNYDTQNYTVYILRSVIETFGHSTK